MTGIDSSLFSVCPTLPRKGRPPVVRQSPNAQGGDDGYFKTLIVAQLPSVCVQINNKVFIIRQCFREVQETMIGHVIIVTKNI